MNTKPVIELENITKSFPGVKALKGFDLKIYENEILGLVGENGAGKSTLMKILIGIYQMDIGRMTLRGEELQLKDPHMAIRYGIGMVFQEGCMISNLTVSENLFLGHEDKFRKFGFVSNRRQNEEAEKIISRLNLDIKPETLVNKLTPAQKQMVEIARQLWLSSLYGQENPVLILDEPTTVLVEAEVKSLFSILHELKKEATIIFISHRLEEVIENSDRIVILKDGDFVSEMTGSEATEKKIEQLMVGHDLSDEHFRESEQIEPEDDVVIEVNGLGLKRHFEPIDFKIRKGEIVSLAGLIGSGKEELCECLAGIRIADAGTVHMNGMPVKAVTPKDTIKKKIGYIPIDRRKDGLATDMNVTENINMLVLDRFKKGGLLNPGRERASAKKWAAETSVIAPSLRARCANLSGGNQQKVVLSKWLAAESQFLILDHPTRGIDVGAKDEIYHRIRELAKEGKSLLIMCDTLEEDIGLSNRMLIMKDGKLMDDVNCPGDNKPSVLDIISSIV